MELRIHVGIIKHRTPNKHILTSHF